MAKKKVKLKAKKKGKKKKKKSEIAETRKAHLALKHTKESAKSCYAAFEAVRRERNATGAPTDGDQDLLRAAVVFAAGGLDITVKELIRGALKRLAAADEDVRAEFEKFTHRNLKSNTNVGGQSDPSRFLAELLTSVSPYDTLIENYIYGLTGSSLQSSDELFKAARALDMDTSLLNSKKTALDTAFGVRNSIIHELDVNFEGGVGHRQRKSRTKPTLNNHSDLFIEVAEYFVKQVEKKLKNLHT